MPSTIFKYPLPMQDTVEIELPLMRWLHVEEQNGTSCIWAEVDPNAEPRRYKLHVRGTGHPMTGEEGGHIGTLMLSKGALVFHVFENKTQ